MKESNSMGMNRTGIQTSPQLTKEMCNLEGVKMPLEQDQVGKSFQDLRNEYLVSSDTLGSIPIPGTIKGIAKSGLDKLRGKNLEVFFDKAGERLAFEKGGTRLYESLVEKCRTLGHTDALRDYDLEQILADEKKHVGWLMETIKELGGDPTSLSPSADSTATAGMGLFQVVNDPRSTLAQTAQAIVTAELIDNDGWELLIKITEEMGLTDAAEKFKVALREEQDHLRKVRAWLEHLVMHEASVTLQ